MSPDCALERSKMVPETPSQVTFGRTFLHYHPKTHAQEWRFNTRIGHVMRDCARVLRVWVFGNCTCSSEIPRPLRPFAETPAPDPAYLSLPLLS